MNDTGNIAIKRREVISNLKRLFSDTKKRALKKGLEFSISHSDLIQRYDRFGGICCVSGIKFSCKESSFYRRPFAPSIDRIDSSIGYTPENTRLVCYAVNAAKNEWTDAILLRICNSVSKMNKQNKHFTALSLAGDTRTKL